MPSLYYKNVNWDAAWEDAASWFMDAAATIPAGFAPWLDASPHFLDYDLRMATGETAAIGQDQGFEGIAIGTGATGTAYLNDGLSFSGIVNGGNFTCADIYAYVTINGGTFSGDGMAIGWAATINGGTFSGDNFVNNGTIAYNCDAVFTGANFTNNLDVGGGYFSGDGFTNGALGTVSTDIGIFSGDDFTNDGTVMCGIFTGSNFVNNGRIYGGVFAVTGFTNNGILSVNFTFNNSDTNGLTGSADSAIITFNDNSANLAYHYGIFTTLKAYTNSGGTFAAADCGAVVLRLEAFDRLAAGMPI